VAAGRLAQPAIDRCFGVGAQHGDAGGVEGDGEHDQADRRRGQLGQQERDQAGAEQGADASGEPTAQGGGEVGLEDDHDGHGEPVAVADGERVGDRDGDGEGHAHPKGMTERFRVEGEVCPHRLEVAPVRAGERARPPDSRSASGGDGGSRLGGLVAGGDRAQLDDGAELAGQRRQVLDGPGKGGAALLVGSAADRLEVLDGGAEPRSVVGFDDGASGVVKPVGHLVEHAGRGTDGGVEVAGGVVRPARRAWSDGAM
jgi:hypothetical protein